MLIVTANIRNNPDMPNRDVVQDARTVAALKPKVVGWQEIGEQSDRQAVIDALDFAPFHTVGLDTSDPVSVNTGRWEILDHVVHVAHHGVVGVNPPRRTVQVDLRQRRHGKPVRLFNSHFTNGAWNGRKPFPEIRQRLWNVHFALLQDLVAQAVAEDWVVVLTGDFNREDMPQVHPRLHWVAGRHSIDKIGLVPNRDWDLHTLDSGHERMNSDHDARWALVRLPAREPAAGKPHAS